MPWVTASYDTLAEGDPCSSEASGSSGSVQFDTSAEQAAPRKCVAVTSASVPSSYFVSLSLAELRPSRKSLPLAKSVTSACCEYRAPAAISRHQTLEFLAATMSRQARSNLSTTRCHVKSRTVFA